MRLRYTDRSRDDIELAVAWYERQQPGLGLAFLDCIDDAIQSILENPDAYWVRYQTYRACVVKRFPFSIFFTREENELIVHSVFHHRLGPKKRP
jgi:plasmid stabilization system protein ParE